MTTTVDRSPQRIDWSFTRGDTWKLDFLLSVPTTASPVTGEPADLSGSTWVLHIRDGSADGALFAAATIDASSQSTGYVSGEVDEAVTRAATAAKKAYYYDLEQSLGGDVVTPVSGYITVIADSSETGRA